MGRKKQAPKPMGVVAAALTAYKACLEIRRGASPLSLRDLEGITGVSHTRWRALLGGSDPRYSSLEKIAEAGEMTVSELLRMGEEALEAAQRERK